MKTDFLQPAAPAETRDSKTGSDEAVVCKELLGNGCATGAKTTNRERSHTYKLKTINKDGNIAEKKFRDETKLVNHLQAMVGNMACKTASITGPDGETDVFKMTRRGWCFAVGYKLPNDPN